MKNLVKKIGYYLKVALKWILLLSGFVFLGTAYEAYVQPVPHQIDVLAFLYGALAMVVASLAIVGAVVVVYTLDQTDKRSREITDRYKQELNAEMIVAKATIESLTEKLEENVATTDKAVTLINKYSEISLNYISEFKKSDVAIKEQREFLRIEIEHMKVERGLLDKSINGIESTTRQFDALWDRANKIDGDTFHP